MKKILLLLAVSLTFLSCESEFEKQNETQSRVGVESPEAEWILGEPYDDTTKKLDSIIKLIPVDEAQARADGAYCIKPGSDFSEGNAIVYAFGKYHYIGWWQDPTYGASANYSYISEFQATSICSFWGT